MNQLTFSQYRKIDLALLCVLTAVFEYIATMATTKWFFLQAMAISITLVMTCITMFRWSAWAALPSLVGAIVYCWVSGGTMSQFLIYCGGSLFCIAALPLLKKFGKENTRIDFIKRTVFATAVYLSVTGGRWLLSLIYHFSFYSLVRFIATDILSLLFTIVVLTLLKNTDGMIEDQKSYLLRLDRERKEEQYTNQDYNF